MTIDPPVIREHQGVLVVRDDLIPGGTKRRVLPAMLAGGVEYAYASPAYGYAQVALAYSCREVGSRATIFTARRSVPHTRTVEARDAGAKIVMVPNGYLSVVRARLAVYAGETGAIPLPFGFDSPEFIAGLADVARGLPVDPPEVWTVAGSGTLSRALQAAWPGAAFHAVRVGKAPDAGRATIHEAPEPFERDAKQPPPFPSCSNYDAKAWRFIARHARPGALFWNVAR
jgi:hypothetical protein